MLNYGTRHFFPLPKEKERAERAFCMISLTFSTFSMILCDGSREEVEAVLALATILLVLLLRVLQPLLLYYGG